MGIFSFQYNFNGEGVQLTPGGNFPFQYNFNGEGVQLTPGGHLRTLYIQGSHWKQEKL